MSLPGTVFIGNPGAGKSSLINCFLHERVFKSGISENGVGVSYKLDIKVAHGRRWMDTPGLSDIKLRKAAATAIDQTLSMGGRYQIMFVLLLVGNRIRAEDLTTISLVLQAANQITQDSYAIMFNQIREKSLKKLKLSAFMGNLEETLRSRRCPTTKYVYFNLFNELMEDEDNVLTDLPEGTVTFIRDLPEININKHIVQDVRTEEFDEIMEANARLIEDVKNAREGIQQAQLDADRRIAERQRMFETAARQAAERERVLQARLDRLDEEERQKQKRLADEERKRAALLQDGDRVRIRHGSFYLNKIPYGTYCATTGRSQIATFTAHERRFDSGTGNGKVTGWSFEIDPSFANDGYRFLYIATTGSAKYDSKSCNSKQLFVTDRLNGTDISFDTPTYLRDVYTYSFLCDTNLSASGYSGGNDKYWVEGKKFQHVSLDHVSGSSWIIERA